MLFFEKFPSWGRSGGVTRPATQIQRNRRQANSTEKIINRANWRSQSVMGKGVIRGIAAVADYVVFGNVTVNGAETLRLLNRTQTVRTKIVHGIDRVRPAASFAYPDHHPVPYVE